MTAADLPELPCYLDGEFTSLRDAKVSVMDRGFIFGDGVYESVPVYAGRPFRFEQHMARLERGLSEMRIANPMSHAQWRGVVERLAVACARAFSRGVGDIDQLVYLQVTRGVAMRDHAAPPGMVPTVMATCNLLKAPSASDRASGVACVSADDFRWHKGHIKCLSLAGAVLARQISADAGAAETVMFRDGFLSEGTASNVWVVTNGAVSGVPRGNLVLEGIRYGLIEELCREARIPFGLRPIARGEVLEADELLLSNASKEVLAVTRLDGRPVGTGVPGPVYANLYAGYQRAKQRR